MIKLRGDYGCATLANRGICSNALRIGRKAIENKVLNLLKVVFVDDPVKFAAFCGAYARRLKDLRTERSMLIAEYRDELVRIEAEYDQMTDASREGRLAPAARAHLERLIARHNIYTRVLTRMRDTVDPLETHYSGYVSQLVDTLAHNRRHQDSFHSLRAAIGQIVVSPNQGATELIVDIKGGRPERRRKPKKARQPPIELKAGNADHSHAAYFGLDARYRGTDGD